jgi:AcrR family transcriptional regulator
VPQTVTAAGSRREDLLAAAARRFVEVGLRRTTMEDVAREAGAGKATLYRHFANKSDLIDALLAREGERLRRRLTRARAAHDEVLAGIEDAFLTGLQFLVEHPVLAKGRDEEPAMLLERVTAHRGPLVETGLDWFAGAIEDGIRSGEVRPVQPRWAAEVLVRLMLSWFAFPPMAIPVHDPVQARAFVHELIVDGLAAR